MVYTVLCESECIQGYAAAEHEKVAKAQSPKYDETCFNLMQITHHNERDTDAI